MDLYQRRRIEAHIDMTPMIDTLLQLFMIFLLTASLVASSVQLHLPKAAAAQKKPVEPIVVSIDAGNDLFFDNVPIARALLRDRLTEVLNALGKHTVVLRADRSLVYQKVLEVLVEIQGSGATQVVLEYEGNATL